MISKYADHCMQSPKIFAASRKLIFPNMTMKTCVLPEHKLLYSIFLQLSLFLLTLSNFPDEVRKIEL
jgi:hypothetical protein